MYVTHAESNAETKARQITFAPISGAWRGLWAYKTPQGVPCHQSNTCEDMIGADCGGKSWCSISVAECKLEILECCGVQVAKTQLQVFVVDAGIL